MITIKVGIKQSGLDFGKFANQIPFATARALTKTADDAKRALEAAIASNFDRPTRITQNSIRVAAATKSSLSALVAVKNLGANPVRWMATEIQGGERNVKAFEKAFESEGVLPSGWTVVPAGGCKLDGNGNPSRSQISQVLTQLRNANSASTSTLFRRSKKGVVRTSDYFVVNPNDPAAARMAPGIYQRSGHTSRKLIYLFIPRRPSYAPRLDFFGIVRKTVTERFNINFREAFAEAVRTARR